MSDGELATAPRSEFVRRFNCDAQRSVSSLEISCHGLAATIDISWMPH